MLVWRTAGERFHPDCIRPSFKSGRTSVMFWGCFIGLKLGPLVSFPQGSINSSKYCEVLEEHLLPFLGKRRKGDHCNGRQRAYPHFTIFDSMEVEAWSEDADVASTVTRYCSSQKHLG